MKEKPTKPECTDDAAMEDAGLECRASANTGDAAVSASPGGAGNLLGGDLAAVLDELLRMSEYE